jgi:hypothetical protein
VAGVFLGLAPGTGVPVGEAPGVGVALPPDATPSPPPELATGFVTDAGNPRFGLGFKTNPTNRSTLTVVPNTTSVTPTTHFRIIAS